MFDRHAIMIVGVPGAGKTSLVHAALAGVPCQARKEGPLTYLQYPGGIELGARREDFSGTDALPMNIMPLARAWLHTQTALDCVALLAEGDRLASGKFLRELEDTGWFLTLVWLDCPVAVAMLRRWDRASHQKQTWLAGRATKVHRLINKWQRCCWRLDARLPVETLAQQLRGHPCLAQLRTSQPVEV